MQRKRNRNGFTVVHHCGEINECGLFFWTLRTHHLDRALIHQRVQVNGHSLILNASGPTTPNIDRFSLAHIFGNSEAIRQREGDVSQAPRCIKVEEATGVE